MKINYAALMANVNAVTDNDLNMICNHHLDAINEYAEKYPTAPKVDEIIKGHARIVNMKKIIQKTRKNADLSDSEKNRIISNCLQVMSHTNFNIENALALLKIRDQKATEVASYIAKTK